MSLTISSFNARAGVDSRGRPFDVGAIVAGLDTDIVAVQETIRPDTEEGWIAKIAGERGYQLIALDVERVDLSPRGVLHHHDGGHSWWGLALLSRIPINRHESISLGSVPTDRATRYAIAADLDNGVRVVTTHPSHHVPFALVQLHRLAAILPDDATPSVVLGDMNLWGFLVDRAFPRPWTRPVRGRTWPARWPFAQIDHVVARGFAGSRQTRVVTHRYSDHRPIRVTLDL